MVLFTNQDGESQETPYPHDRPFLELELSEQERLLDAAG
jgi:hypothetical protein